MTRLALSVALLGLPLTGWADTRRFALVAGANDGGDDRVRLRYAVTDAEAFAGVLEDLGGVPPSNQTLLMDPDATVFRDAIDNLAATVATAEDRGLRTEVVVYYSGHSDEQGLLLGEERYPYAELRADLKGIGADVQVVVLDSCASGAMVRTKGGVHRPAFLEDQSNDVEGTAYLMSASADESAQESDVVEASYFTHFLVSGMRGGADRTGDGRVTLSEAYAYASAETLRRTERTSIGPQHAIFDMNMKGHGGFVFTDITQTDSSLIFDEGLAGRLFVRDDEGTLVAELTKVPDRAMEVALEQGTYTVILEQDDHRLEAVFEIGGAEHLLVTDLEFVPITVDASIDRGKGGVPPVPPEPPEVSVRTDVHAAQLGIVPRSAETVGQVGILGAHTDHNRGLQLSGLYTRAGEVDGGQVTLFYTEARELRGAQVSTGVNLVTDASDGAQVGLINAATDSLRGTQVGLINHAQEMNGAQVGLVNESPDARGLQLGLVNSGGDGSGLQVGLVNLARDYEGGAIGLVTVHKQGYNHLFVNTGTENSVLLSASWGSRFVYTSAQIGTRGIFSGGPTAVVGAGLHIPRGALYVDTDLAFGGLFGNEELRSGLMRFRAQPGWALGERFALQTGLVIETRLRSGLTGQERLGVGWTVGLRI